MKNWTDFLWAEKLPKWHKAYILLESPQECIKILNTGIDLLHVVFELLDSAFVQIAAEQREQVGG